MPLYRRVATRIHPMIFSLVVGRRVTESTNGFRAVHRRVHDDLPADRLLELVDPLVRVEQVLAHAVGVGPADERRKGSKGVTDSSGGRVATTDGLADWMKRRRG